MAVRVVLAEDEAIIRLDLKEILQGAGYEVVADTGRGDVALDLIREHAPDLAILDIKMPGLDGLEVAKAVSEESLCAVLILTAFSQRDLVDQATDAGAMGYLVKPFQASELMPAVEVALARYADMRALADANAGLGARNSALEASLRTRREVERAKGKLMDDFGLAEGDAFAFIQKSAMTSRNTMAAIAARVLQGELAP